MRCRYCGYSIRKTLIGWMHNWPPPSIHIARPDRPRGAA